MGQIWSIIKLIVNGRKFQNHVKEHFHRGVAFTATVYHPDLEIPLCHCPCHFTRPFDYYFTQGIMGMFHEDFSYRNRPGPPGHNEAPFPYRQYFTDEDLARISPEDLALLRENGILPEENENEN